MRTLDKRSLAIPDALIALSSNHLCADGSSYSPSTFFTISAGSYTTLSVLRHIVLTPAASGLSQSNHY